MPEKDKKKERSSRMGNNPIGGASGGVYDLLINSDQKFQSTAKTREREQVKQPSRQGDGEDDDEFKRHTLIIRKTFLKKIKRIAFEQESTIKDVLDDVLTLGLKHFDKTE